MNFNETLQQLAKGLRLFSQAAPLKLDVQDKMQFVTQRLRLFSQAAPLKRRAVISTHRDLARLRLFSQAAPLKPFVRGYANTPTRTVSACSVRRLH